MGKTKMGEETTSFGKSSNLCSHSRLSVAKPLSFLCAGIALLLELSLLVAPRRLSSVGFAWVSAAQYSVLILIGLAGILALVSKMIRPSGSRRDSAMRGDDQAHPSRRRWYAVPFAMPLVILATSVLALVTSARDHVSPSAANTCMNNQRAVMNVIDLILMEGGHLLTTIDDPRIRSAIGKIPECPDNGSHSVTSGTNVHCSITGHNFLESSSAEKSRPQ